jgi:hypothetical protein
MVERAVVMVERAVVMVERAVGRWLSGRWLSCPPCANAMQRAAPLKFYMTPMVYTSERQNHLTTEHSVEIAAWLEREFTPRGWVALNYGRLHIARSLDSCCNGDGLHPAHIEVELEGNASAGAGEPTMPWQNSAKQKQQH